MNSATLHLFNAIMVSKQPPKFVDHQNMNSVTIPKGYVLDPKLMFTATNKIRQDIENYVISFTEWNNSFYKSWAKLQTLPNWERRRDQLVHYFTTYNYAEMSIDIDKFMYVPEGEIDLPEQLSFLYIKSITKDQVIERLNKMLSSAVALKAETQDDIMTILENLTTDVVKKLILTCKNKEIASKAAIKFNIIPKNATEFLRLIITQATGNSLIIKNEETIEALKNINSDVVNTFMSYVKTNDIKNLAEVFYRYKPLWLALRSDTQIRPYINKMRRLAKKYHKPMQKDLLNDITAMIRRGDNIYKKQFFNALDKVNTFRKIRLLYALKNMDSQDVVYKIRNGKSHAAKRNLPLDYKKKNTIFKVLYESVIEDLKKNVQGKVIKVDSNIKYALPATEKQFIGAYPSGTSVEIQGNAVIGVHWQNQNGKQTDLDLSLLSVDKKIGWDGEYQTSSIQFSGDLTNAPAPNGASEFFYFNTAADGLYLLQLNYFNYGFSANKKECPFDLILASSEQKDIKHMNHMFDADKIILQAKSSIGRRQKVIGIVKIKNGKTIFYFSESQVQASMTSREDDTANIHRNFMKYQLEHTIKLEYMLLLAGAKLQLSSDSCKADIDLTVADKDTILQLFY